ncbi:SUKH-4 family immunity protein [Streptomyces flavofungini]|uniref:SUKH-4 family immunity protein n=1 Tax=Streptomyces flavofungini TaxID=68200 RepID=UPI0034DF7FC1
MLFDVTHGKLAAIFGEDRLAFLPSDAFAPAAADSAGARLLRTVGVPAEALWPREPDAESGRLPLVRDVVDTDDFEDAPQDSGEWPVIGWLLNAHLALDPVSGKVYAFDLDEDSATELHADVSSLIHVTVRFQRLLEEFTFSDHDDEADEDDDVAREEADFERLEHEVERIRQETSALDPLPFQDDETAWSVIAGEIAAGQHFAGDSPGARSLYG